MKKLVSLAFLVMISTVLFAQTTKEELKVAKEIFQMEKKAMVANFVELPETHVFWNIYEEYENERKKFANERYELLLQYAGNYVNYSDDRLEKIMQRNLQLRSSMEKMRLKYYKRIKKECGPKTATQFWMVQRFYESSVNSKILGNLPILEN